ncbi:hypothetical protein D1007_10203 [Hordeum vulgare]|nr:hypothetical protein D1007_10203 [Hordeum vulgare]
MRLSRKVDAENALYVKPCPARFFMGRRACALRLLRLHRPDIADHFGSRHPQPWPAVPPRRSPWRRRRLRREPSWAARSTRGTSRCFVTIDCCPRLPKYWCTSLAPRPLPHLPRERSWSLSSTSTGDSGSRLALFSPNGSIFGLQPHHLAPSAILQLAAFVVLCEGFVGIEPRVDLWDSLFFFKQQSIDMEKSEVEKLKGPRPMTPCGAALVHHRSKSGFPQMPLQESIKHWQKDFFYVKSADPT